MAELYPFSNYAAALLANVPRPGKTHLWFAKMAGALRHECSAKVCREVLAARVKDVVHRPVPVRELDEAVRFACGGRGTGSRCRGGVLDG